MMKGADLHPKTIVYNLYRRLKRRLGCSLRASFYQRSVVRQGKKATHKYSRVKGCFSGPSKVQGPVSNQTVLVAADTSTIVAYITNKDKPTRQSCALSYEGHDLVPSLSDNSNSQTHYHVELKRVPRCLPAG